MASPSEALKPGTRFRTRNGRREGEVGAVLGAGGQGAVYQARMDGGTFALKWYHDYYVDIDAGLFARLSSAVQRGAPDNRFLWPLDLVDIEGQRSFGYLMPLRDEAYAGMRDLIAPPPQRLELDLPQRLQACEHIAQCFLELHAAGFCYQDINFGNIFLHPRSADVLICDNDNVNIDGADASIYGTRKFMAPEVVRRETLPCTKTDLFSMAVMFFYVTFAWHPLDGRRELEIKLLDAAAEERLYGTEPVFIFDPVNTANGLLSPMHDAIANRWGSLNGELRALFERSFTLGLFTPGRRVHEYEWRSAFASARRAVASCGACGYAYVHEPDAAEPMGCARCGAALVPPAALRAGRRVITLPAGRAVTFADIDERQTSERLVGEVQAHPSKPQILGLANRTDAPWRVEIPGYSAAAIPPGKTVRLLHGTSIAIGDRHLTVSNPQDVPA